MITYVLTLRFDPIAQEHFESMRQRYFPPERNLVPAHLSLFHTLPASEEVTARVTSIALTTRVFTLAVTGFRFLGRGVAYTLAAPEVISLHRKLADAFAAHVSAQDKQTFRPHVVIQNKSTSEKAWMLLALLQGGFQNFQVTAEGMDLWYYRDGPWELAQEFSFYKG